MKLISSMSMVPVDENQKRQKITSQLDYPYTCIALIFKIRIKLKNTIKIFMYHIIPSLYNTKWLFKIKNIVISNYLIIFC